jgi:hypothetical protein
MKEPSSREAFLSQNREAMREKMSKLIQKDVIKVRK